MASIGDVVFSRSHDDDDDDENDDELWVDEDLIKANDDNAIDNIMKDEMVKRSGDDLSPSSPPKSSSRNKTKKNGAADAAAAAAVEDAADPDDDAKADDAEDSGEASKRGRRPRRRSKNKAVNGWKVGHRCAAYFADDGRIYDAIVKSIDAENFTCVVRYIGYGNEEEQNIDELLPCEEEAEAKTKAKSRRSERRRTKGETTQSETYSDEDYEEETILDGIEDSSSVGDASESRLRGRGGARRGRGRGRHRRGRRSGLKNSSQSAVPLAPGGDEEDAAPPGTAEKTGDSRGKRDRRGRNKFKSQNIPSSCPANFALPFSPGNFPFPGSNGTAAVSPSALPTPLPTSCGGGGPDADALHAMLVSWYMSGYHTGYYQGLKDARK